MIRKFFTVFGVISFIIVCAYGAMMLGYRMKFGNVQQTSKEFTDKVMPLIFTKWDYDQLRAHSHKRFLESASPEKLKALFESLAKIGPMKAYKGAVCNAGMNYFSETDGTFAWAKCMNSAEFEKGTAQLGFTLLKSGGNEWQIKDLNINQNYKDAK